MQEAILDVKKIRMAQIDELCEKGEYGKAIELWMNTQIDLGEPLLMGNYLSDFFSGFACGMIGEECCCEEGCGKCLLGGCGLVLCGLCCFTVCDGGDFAQNFCSWGTKSCENACERMCCS